MRRWLLTLVGVSLLALGVSAWDGGSQQAAPPTPRVVIPEFGTGSGAISGVVVDARTGRPIAGAIAGIAILMRNVIGPARRQTTDSRGRFVFTDLPASDGYILSARKTGYESDGAFGRGSATTPRALSLADREWRSDATIRLWRQAAINGTVTDEAGEPVAGATVMLLGRLLVSGQPQLAAGPSTKTDDRGIYRFAGLPPGKYLVSVPSVQWSVPADADVLTLTGQTPERIAQIETAGGTVAYRRDPSIVADSMYRLLTGSFPTPPPPGRDGRLQTYPTWYYPAARQPLQATPLDLALGDDRQGIDIQIQPVPTARIRGRVDAAQEVRANLTLRLVTDETESLGPGGEIATAMVTTSGEFTFLGVPSGRYTIVASAVVGTLQMRPPGGAAVDRPPMAPAQFGRGSFGSAIWAAPPGTFFDSQNTLSAPGWYGRTAVDVGTVDVSGVVVGLRRGITLRGRIVNDGGAPPSAGRGPSVLSVRLAPADGRVALGAFRANVRPGDPEQSFVVEGLLPGEYVIEASSGNAALPKSIVWDGKDYTYRPFDTTSGADIDGVVVTMTTQACEINGTAVDARGAPIASGAVIYFPVEREQWTKFGFQPTRLRSVAVTTGGVFTITRIPAGEYFVIAVSDTLADRWQDPEFLTRVAPLATKVSLQWGSTVTQALTLRDVK